MLSRIALYIARIAAGAVRPLEVVALLSLRGFMTPRGPILFFAAMALVIGAMVALIVYAPEPGHAAIAKIVIGLLAYALFVGYARAYFAVRAETEAALAGLLRDDGGETVSVRPDVLERVSPTPRFPGVLNRAGLAVFLAGLTVSFTAVCAGVSATGLALQPLDDLGLPATPGARDWALFALWAALGAVDVFSLGPRADEPIGALRYEWSWLILWLAIFRLTLLGVGFSLLSSWFDARRKVSIALQHPGLWWEKRQHFLRLGRDGFDGLGASLADPDPARREDAARMLGEIGFYPNEAAANLVDALGDREPAVRARAAESLKALGQAAAGATHALIERLEDPEPVVRREAAAALGRTAEGRANLAATAMAALAAFAPEDAEQAAAADWATLVALAKSLAELSASVGLADEAAVQAVDRLRGHPDGYVRQTAVEAFGQLRSVARPQEAAS